MKIVNRTSEMLTYVTYAGDSSKLAPRVLRPVAGQCQDMWIHPGQPHDRSQGEDTVLITVFPGEYHTCWGVSIGRPTPYAELAGPYSNKTTVLLTRNAGHRIVGLGSGSAEVPPKGHGDRRIAGR